MASTRVEVTVKDMRWFREVALRLDDLFDALADEDLSDTTDRRIDALRSAINAEPVDDLPEP